MGHEKGEQRQSPKIRNLLTAYAPVQTFTFSKVENSTESKPILAIAKRLNTADSG